MRVRPAVPFVLLTALLATACGKKGDIRPPLVLRPQPVEKLTAVQRGTRVILEWTDPTVSVDGTGLPGLSEAEVWLEVRPDPPSPRCPRAPSGALASQKGEGEGHRTGGRAQCKQINNSRRSGT